MTFMISLWDIGLWLAVSSFLMIVTSELISPHYGRINTVIEFKRIRRLALSVGIAYLCVASINIVSMLSG